MTFDADAVFGLKRHFIGALSAGSRVELRPSPAPRLAFGSDGALALGAGGCVVDFGVVASPGTERRTLRIAGIGSTITSAAIADAPPWLQATPASAPDELVLIAEHDVVAATKLDGVLRMRLAGNTVVEATLGVRMLARPAHAAGRYDFHGSARPRAFDFGAVDPADAAAVREISVESATSVPLIVSFSDLPPCLTFACDGRQRRGPIAGCFFERAAPFRVALRPVALRQTMGRQSGTLRMRTNDRDPSFHDVELPLSAVIEPKAPFVVGAAPRDGKRTRRGFIAVARLENWGAEPARLSVGEHDPALDLRSLPDVPAARQGRPGVAVLPILIDPSKLGAGLHPLSIVVGVIGGEPPVVTVPLRVNVVGGSIR